MRKKERGYVVDNDGSLFLCAENIIKNITLKPNIFGILISESFQSVLIFQHARWRHNLTPVEGVVSYLRLMLLTDETVPD